MNYVRRVRVQHPGTSNEHVAELEFSPVPTVGPLQRATRETVHAWIVAGHRFITVAPDGSRARIAAFTSSTGTRYVATVADGRETNNLLALPRS